MKEKFLMERNQAPHATLTWPLFQSKLSFSPYKTNLEHVPLFREFLFLKVKEWCSAAHSALMSTFKLRIINHMEAAEVRHFLNSINGKQELLTQIVVYFFFFFNGWSFSSVNSKILKEIKNTALKGKDVFPVLCCQDNCIFNMRDVKYILLSGEQIWIKKWNYIT